MNKFELMELFQVSQSTIDTNFPTFAVKQLAKGKLITKIGKGQNAEYYVEDVEPQIVDKSYFSFFKKQNEQDLEGEIWVPAYPHPEDYEVSNLGRFRNKKTKKIQKGSVINGYVKITMFKNEAYRLHRVVLMSFDPVDNAQDFTVDHINGNKLDNKLENLRWCSSEENIKYMILHRAELNKELTRLIEKYGSYDAVLELLQTL